jgi:hypothetical protein
LRNSNSAGILTNQWRRFGKGIPPKESYNVLVTEQRIDYNNITKVREMKETTHTNTQKKKRNERACRDKEGRKEEG